MRINFQIVEEVLESIYGEQFRSFHVYTQCVKGCRDFVGDLRDFTKLPDLPDGLKIQIIKGMFNKRQTESWTRMITRYLRNKMLANELIEVYEDAAIQSIITNKQSVIKDLKFACDIRIWRTVENMQFDEKVLIFATIAEYCC
jgi:hypothetical protein